nr:NUDIX domain-containing protein [Paenibacillus phyllosphaerae]
MHVGRKDLYKLPGGGVDPGEDPQAAFLREIKEETGYEAEIIQAIGYIEEHKARNAFMQYSYCYIARALRQSGATQLTASEQRLGLVIQWMTLELAVTAMDHSIENCADYSTLFMLVRDRTILQHAHAISLFESLR